LDYESLWNYKSWPVALMTIWVGNVIVVFVIFRSTVVHVSTSGANYRRNPRGWRRDGVRPGSLGPLVLRQLRTESDTADDGIRGRRRTGCRRDRRSGRVNFRRNWHRGRLGTAGHAHWRPSDDASCPARLSVALTRSDRRSIKIFFYNNILCNLYPWHVSLSVTSFI